MMDLISKKAFVDIYVTILSILIVLSILIFSQNGSAEELDLVLAVDTSGSLLQDHEIETITDGIPAFIRDLEKNNYDIRLGMVSWDDNIDFIIKPTKDYDRILQETANLSASETEFTDLSVGMNGAIQALDGSNGNKAIIFIVGGSEFKSFSSLPNQNEYMINFILINSRMDSYTDSKLREVAFNVSNSYNGYVSFIPGDPKALEKALKNVLHELHHPIPDLAVSRLNPSRPKKRINATEIADCFHNKTNIKLDGYSVEGDLNISYRIVKSNFIITNSIINGSLNLTGSIFEKPIILYNTIFKGKVVLDKVTLREDLDLEDARFLDDFQCRDGVFKGKTSFFNSSFLYPAYFSGSAFFGPISFANARFNSVTTFYQTIFSTDDISFRRSKFFDNTFFIESSFNGSTFFEDNLFRKDASFNYARFRSSIIFKNLSFEGDSQFSQSVFLGYALFNEVNFNDDSDFSMAKFNKGLNLIKSNLSNTLEIDNSEINGPFKADRSYFKNGINLSNSFLYDLSLDNNRFNGHIRLNDTNITRMATHWNYLVGHVEYDQPINQFILENYKKLGWRDDYDSCLYDQKYARMIKEPLGLSKALDITAWISSGFGLRLRFILFWSFLIISLFAFIYKYSNALEKTNPSKKLFSRNGKTSKMDAIYFSSILFVAQAPSEFKPIDKYRFLVIIEGILGWLFMGLLIAVMIAKFTR